MTDSPWARNVTDENPPEISKQMKLLQEMREANEKASYDMIPEEIRPLRRKSAELVIDMAELAFSCLERSGDNKLCAACGSVIAGIVAELLTNMISCVRNSDDELTMLASVMGLAAKSIRDHDVSDGVRGLLQTISIYCDDLVKKVNEQRLAESAVKDNNSQPN